MDLAAALSGFDLGAAKHCARLAASQYRHAGQELPKRLADHLRRLENFAPSSDYGTERQEAQRESVYDVIDADQAARLLGCSTRYVRKIHTDLDGRQVAGRWIFNHQTVIDYSMAKRSA